jgi:peptidyl-prolyl cis-trans isomerase D
MLQSIRDGLGRHKWLQYMLLGALALVFAAWGAYGIVNLNVQNASYAAEANGQKISLQEARDAWQRMSQERLGGADLPDALRAHFQDQVLEGLVREALMTDRTHDLGYRPALSALSDAITKEPAFQINGKYSPDAAKAALAQAGMSEQSYEDRVRTSLQRTQLEEGIRDSEFQTPVELARSQALQNEQREVRYAEFGVDKFPGAAVDDAAVQAYYKAHQASYRTPETAHVEYAELRLDQLAAQTTVSDDDLKKAYEKNRQQYVQAEKRHASHILIAGTGNDAADKKLADDVYAQAKAGKDFAQLAKQYSKDPGSAQKGGDLGWADRTTFVGPFTDALFSMSAGDIHAPVKTEFGYHIIRLDEVQAGKTKTYDEARPELEADVRKNKATDRFGEIQEQLQTQMENSPGATLEGLAKEFQLQTGDVPQFQRGAGGGSLGAAPPVQELVFGAAAVSPGRLAGPVVVGDDRLLILKVVDRHPPQAKPLAEVRESIVATLKKDNGLDAAYKAAEAVDAKLTAGGSFDDVVKGAGLTAEPARFIGRNDPAVPGAIRTMAFEIPKPAGKPEYRVVKLDTGAALVMVTQSRVDTAVANPQMQAALGKQQAGRVGMETTMAYLEDVRRTAKVTKNPKAFE